MREPEALQADIRAHLDAENAWTEAALAPVAGLRRELVAELKGRIKEDDSSVFADCDVLVSTPLRLSALVSARAGKRLAAVEIVVVRPHSELLLPAAVTPCVPPICRARDDDHNLYLRTP